MRAQSIKPHFVFAQFAPEVQPLALLVGSKPMHWAKNLLIFAALVFSEALFTCDVLTRCILGFGLFCVAGSGAYIANDLFDRETDRLHPCKQHRPIAAGLIDPTTGLISAAALQTIALAGAFLLSTCFGCILLAYLLLSAAYNLLFKNIAILDAFCVAFSFLLRAFAGASLACAPMSPWLIGCTLALGLFMSFAKRKKEGQLLGVDAAAHRPSLSGYKPGWLNWFLGASAAAVVIGYTSYTLWSATALQIGNNLMTLTVPFVWFGVWRFLHLLGRDNESSDPIRLLFADRLLIANNLLWAASVMLIIYG
jgi:4-hydroxybenzoate polyprenyltransferase